VLNNPKALSQSMAIEHQQQPLTDDQLVLQYLDGRIGAFEELYDRYSRRLLAFLHGEVGSVWAEDLLQETFSRLLTSLDRYSPSGKFSAYVYEIARNLARDRQRRLYRDMPISDVVGAEEACHPDLVDHMEYRLEMAWVRNALKNLSTEQQEVVLLREYAGLSFKEIANVIERPIGTVLSQMHRALKTLRHHLGGPESQT
jgi:RNA polymerase sigma-70 factor (ECF subfamily)